MLNLTDVKSLSLDADRWEQACQFAQELCASGTVPALSFLFARHGSTPGVQAFGHLRVTDDGPDRNSPRVTDEAIYLIASITKPIVAMGAMLLIERGQLTLGDRVSRYISGFGAKGKNGTKIWHLLTHTSGLPDMLAHNQPLREEHASLETFVRETAACQPDFSPGRGVQYQSMGFAALGEIIRVVSGVSCAEFLRREFFEPLGMHDTALGAPDDWFTEGRTQRIPEIVLPEAMRGTDWGWNGRYWRQLGAPWGGLLTTPMDLGRFAQMMLDHGLVNGQQLLSRQTVFQSTRNQLSAMPDLPPSESRGRGWGFGWRRHWPTHTATFGDLVGPNTYGHFGATGTMLWLDPDAQAFLLVLTTQPMTSDNSHLTALSNLIVSAMH